MTTTIRCPNCNGIFDSHESYQSHLPCESKTLGGYGDLVGGSGQYAKEGDTGERKAS